MVFEKQELASDFVLLLQQVDIDGIVEERWESCDGSASVDKLMADFYWVVNPAPGQGFQTEIFYEFFAQGYAPTAVRETQPALQKEVLEGLLVRRAVHKGSWRGRPPCSKGDLQWYAEITGLGNDTVLASARAARQEFLRRHTNENTGAIIGALVCCALGAVLWVGSGLSLVSGLLLGSGVVLGIFATTRR